MPLPPPARLALSAGVAGLLLVIGNQLTAAQQEPALIRAGVLAALLAVGLMLVAALWTRAMPETAVRADLAGREGIVLDPDLPAPIALELGWGSQMLLTATPAVVVIVMWRSRELLRRGLLVDSSFDPGEICQRVMEQQRALGLVNLTLYPGRGEFDGLLPGLPAVHVQPLGSQGVLVLGGWSARCFGRSDLLWIEGWAQRLTTEMLASERHQGWSLKKERPLETEVEAANAPDPLAH